tara:strand:+ start:483 stop:1346 length:864 start_codon:yes stop_codon:yes gene_type:complete
MEKIKNKNTFRLFNYKWKNVPEWGLKTEDIYIKWYLKRYKFQNILSLKKFLKTKKNILDAGCGLGRDTKLFAKLNPNANIFACDQSQNAIKEVKKNLKQFKNVIIFKADITKKIKINKKFDFISCDQVLHHTPNPGLTLKNLYSNLNVGGYLNFFTCRKKNPYRDFVDDELMNYFQNKSPQELWKFSEIVTNFGKALYDLKINNIKFNKKKYSNLQLFIHNQIFRCWYNPKIDFKLSISSNYDWFSNNPRYSLRELKKILKTSLKNFKIVSTYEDDASVSIKIKKLK